MATITAAAGGGNWNATGTWTGGVIPTAADDVVLATTSGAVTIPAAITALGRSLTTQTGSSLTMAATTSVLTLGDASGGAMTLSSGMTLTLTGIGTINFVSTSSNGGTGWSITTAGKTLPNVTFSGVGGKWVQADAITATGATVSHTGGTWATSNFSVTATTINNTGVATRVWSPGSSTLTMSGSTANFRFSNLTVSPNTATLTINGVAPVFAVGSTSFGDFAGLNLVFAGSGQANLQGSNAANTNTFGSVTRVGTATKTDTFGITSTNLTCTGTFTVTGNSAVNRVLLASSVPGISTAGTTTTLTAAAVSLTNVDIMDIAGAGAAAPFTGTSLGDCQGNSGITFPAGVTRYGVVAGNWSSTATWSTTSGGAGGASVPLPQDTVRLDANSAVGTYTLDMPRACKDLDCTGFTRSINFGSTAPTFYGSFTLVSTMTWVGSSQVNLSGRGTHTFATGGKSFPQALIIGAPIAAGVGTYTMQDALSGGTTGATIPYTLITQGFSMTVAALQVSGPCLFSTSVVSITTTSFTMSVTTADMSAATVVFTVASASVHTFAGNSRPYGTLTYTVANSPGGLTITGANTFVTLNVGSGRTLTLPSSTTTVVTNWNVVGQNNGYIYMAGTNGNHASAPDSAATSITGDLDLRIRMAPDVAAAQGSMLAKWDTLGTTQAYAFYLDGTGKPALALSTTGSNALYSVSTVATPLTAGVVIWLRVTRRQSDGRVQFFTASGALTNPVASDFTQLGADVTGTTTALLDTTASVTVGQQANSVSNGMVGKVYRAQIRNGIDGTVVFDADFVNKTFGANTFTESSSQAATVTLNGTAPVGDGRIFLNSSTGGTAATISKTSGSVISGYLKIQDSTATGGATWYAGASSISVSNNTGWQFINMPVGVNQTALWNVYTPISTSRTGLWNARAALGLSRITLWNTRTKVTKNLTGLWNVRTPVNKTSIGLWNVRAKIGLARTALWNVRSLASSSRTALWNTRSLTSATRSVVWNVRTPTGGTRTVLWNILASTSVGRSQTMLWGVRTATGSTRTALWSTRAPIATTRTALWNIRKPVTLDRTVRWNLRTPIAQTRTALWRITQPVALTRTAKWNTRNAVNRTTVARWNTRSNAGRTWTALWRVRYHDRDITARFGQPTSGWYTQPPTSTQWRTQPPRSDWHIREPAQGEI